MTDNNEPEIEITDEQRKEFFAYIDHKERCIRQLRWQLWYTLGCAGVSAAIAIWYFFARDVLVFLPGGALSMELWRDTSIPTVVVLLVAILVGVYLAWTRVKRLKCEQMDLKEARDAGIKYGVLAG